jgi:hypothetical protein
LNKKDNVVIDDNLIRRALQLEIESVEPPAAGQLWRSIEARLDHPPVSLKKPAPVWIRYAGLAAAACLLLIFGGIGLMRVAQFASPANEYDAAAEFLTEDEEERLSASDSAPSEISDEPLDSATGIETKPDEKAGQQAEESTPVTVAGVEEETEDDQFIVAATPSTDDPVGETRMLLWPDKLGEDYLFSEEIVLPPVEEDPLRVALFSNSEHNLLLVSLEALEDNPIDFVEKVGLQMQFPINDVQYQDDYLFFVAGGYNGLVFQQDGVTRAIMAPLNSIKKEQLIDLAAPFR